MESYINVDKNMVVNTTIGDAEVVWSNVINAPFELHGFYEPNNGEYFRRLPDDVAEATSKSVKLLHRESAGGRVRFSTNSPYIAIRARFLAVGRSSHLTLISSAGFDLYSDGEFGSRFIKEFRLPMDTKESYEQIIHLNGEHLRSYTVTFPVHSVVEKLEIGLKPGAVLSAPRPYRNLAPITVYGSSIVHGTAATRPGTTYPAIISRNFNIDYRNIGFSGHAKGEPAIARWLAELPTSVFVCDYDHNAPSVEHLHNTHYNFYSIIREKNPELPYIMITRPNYWTCPNDKDIILRRREVIMHSYLRARENGDENVYFIDGMSFFIAPNQYEQVVDGIHPNDAGFVRMADSIGTVIRYILEEGAENGNSHVKAFK